MREHIASLPKKKRQELKRLRNPDECVDMSDEEPRSINYTDVAEGNTRINISHAGGEMEDLHADLDEELNGVHKKKYKEKRTRFDSTARRVLGFRGQMAAITDTYVKWGATQGEFGLNGTPEVPKASRIQKNCKITVVDVFSTYKVSVPMVKEDLTTVTCYIGQGLIPCAPYKASIAVSIRPWMKTLTDLHGVAFQPYHVQQFLICFDVYLEILKNVDIRVKRALGRDTAHWRTENSCPSCTYKLKGEPKMIFEMLVTMDGNNSLKRVLTKDQDFDENGVPKRGGCERPDPRTATAGGDYFLSRERVDLWAKEVLASQVRVPSSDDPEEQTHAKYGLAMMDAILDAFGPNIGGGYNIGCGFETTIKNSPLGPQATELNLKMLVGAFHGHAHNHLCQLRYLATYVPGLGLEDLEGCERFFSKSNALARSVCYASVFHRRQAIATYLEHTDTFETYPNLSKFLVDNYNQALTIIDLEESLKFAMEQAGIDGPEVFEQHLQQELAYLRSLSKEPMVETDQIEYYQRLSKVAEQKEHFDLVFAEGSKANGTVRHHARENYDKAEDSVQEIERKLNSDERWTPDMTEWKNAADLVTTRRYRLAVDKLELLVVKRLFELTKMNMSQTGIQRGSLNSVLGQLQPPQLMDTHFKILRAREEIIRLNVEIRRFVTYMQDEREQYRWRRGRFDKDHMKRFQVMKKRLGPRFTGTLLRGVRREPAAWETPPTPMEGQQDLFDQAEAEAVAREIEKHRGESGSDESENEDSDEGEDAEEERLAETLETVVVIATDKDTVE
ncbi:hypothetical protein B0H16DRAFT_1736701 [Mycena metata]|uniref:CxC2-like cysteine cluster KDZ transposase-associated domain-containing protein n=1 Tax=Mycena metata TaxID=1033252 RepID=A0AAD7HNB6_9AGAR|nr:hypothetical protein B0H16DRAFT_1736701 [Mycena metata]